MLDSGTGKPAGGVKRLTAGPTRGEGQLRDSRRECREESAGSGGGEDHESSAPRRRAAEGCPRTVPERAGGSETGETEPRRLRGVSSRDSALPSHERSGVRPFGRTENPGVPSSILGLPTTTPLETRAVRAWWSGWSSADGPSDCAGIVRERRARVSDGAAAVSPVRSSSRWNAASFRLAAFMSASSTMQ